ncbi:MAG: GntR family transcriptional regulator [Proteobacteria bacterium]|nr:GntR family transcriptional regulator [Pseudomonadota bacterium]
MPRPSNSRVAPFRAPIPIDRTLPTSGQIYRALRKSIVSLAYEPGEPISEVEIAAAAEVSRTPVREALGRLQEDRLVVILPSRGTVVSLISVPIVRQALRLRRLLEGDVAAECALALSDALAVEIDAALADHRGALARGDIEAGYIADERFHQALFDAFNLDLLWSNVSQARLQMERVHNLMVRELRSRDSAVVFHARIRDAIFARDPARARQAMIEHIDASSDFVDALQRSSHRYVAQP